MYPKITNSLLKRTVSLFIALFVFVAPARAFLPDDSLKLKVKVPRHYFMPTFFMDYYSTGKKDFKTKNGDADRLGSYQYSQYNGTYTIPILTHDFQKDSVTTANFHLLTTGNFLFAMPRFDSLKNHTIGKFGIGVRAIYNTGKKGIWFFDFSPYFAQDLSHSNSMVFRYANTIIYDRVFNQSFSMRFGYAKTFLWGNRFHLPYVGVRFGRLDKTYFSIQFPRNVTFSWPMGRNFRGSLYIKPMGGVYNFANSDTLYYGKDETVQFGRYEVLNGLRFEYHPSRHFGMFMSAGFTGRRQVSFSSFSYNKDKKQPLGFFISEGVQNSSFMSIGLTVRFGKAKRVYNNRNIYEMFDLNNSIDPGDNNSTPNSSDIPSLNVKKKHKASVRDIQDLLEIEDLYQ